MCLMKFCQRDLPMNCDDLLGTTALELEWKCHNSKSCGRGKMQEYQLDEHQRAAVEALANIKEVCERNNIQYFLTSGSLLGAVRHGGMIPWDDDIDLGFLYEDWLRIKKILPKELDSKFTYLDRDANNHYHNLYPKVIYNTCLCVDLFPIVKWTGKRMKGEFRWIVMKLIRAGFYFSFDYMPYFQKGERFKKFYWSMMRLLYLLLKPFLTTERLLKFCRRNECHFENSDTDWYVTMYDAYPMKTEMIRADWLKPQSEVWFEGKTYTTFADAHAFLAHLYGEDYMTPKKTRPPHTAQFSDDGSYLDKKTDRAQEK